MSSTETITTEEEAAAAEAQAARERKKRQQKQLLGHAELDIILRDLHQELHQLNVKKKEYISKAADRMAAIIPKNMIAKELIQGLKLLNYRIDRSYIYEILKEKWPFEDLSENRQIDEDKDLEDSRERLIQSGKVTREEIAKGPAKMDFYRDWYNESWIEIDSELFEEIRTMRGFPYKVLVKQQKGRGIELKKIDDDPGQ